MSSVHPRKPRRGEPLAHQRRFVVRDLALELKTRAEIAREYKVAASSVTRFAQSHAREIDELRAALGNELLERLAGFWIAKQEHRISVLQAIAETDPDPKTVIAALRAVAEELGQLPPRANMVIMPVTHVIEGVDIAALK